MIDDKLADILSLRRGAGSLGEQYLIDNYIVPTGAQPDKYGNYILRIGTSPVLWSCHTDTVHNPKPILRHKLVMTEDETRVMSKNDVCLGADNGAGIWLCLELIAAGVEGLYIFHREEEIGGLGSSYIAKRTPEVVDGIKYAIAFDRRGTGSIITHQGTKTCSNEFAESLAEQLYLGHKPDDTGTFTDTANYAGLIPECTNISAGFHHEHSYKEWLDMEYLYALRDSLLALKVENLEVYRDVDDHSYSSNYFDDYLETGLYDGSNEGYVGAALIYSYPVRTYHILQEMGVLDEVLEALEIYRESTQ